VASISLEGQAFPQTRGFVHVEVFGTDGLESFSVPVDRPWGAHSLDFTFVWPVSPPYPLEIVMRLQPGIESMNFTGISVMAEPPWVGPGPGID
jgi:hypothetical protein